MWLADSEDADQAFFQLFQRLRALAVKSGLHAAWLEDHNHVFSAEAIWAKLCKFKKRTSTGTDWLNLFQLRSAPDAVLQSLGAALQQILIRLVGPSTSFEVILDLIPKKSGGFRTTATLASSWRLLTSILI